MKTHARHRNIWGLLLTALVACDSPTAATGPDTQVVDEYRVGGIVFTAWSRALQGDTLEVTLTARNETDVRAQAGILGGTCMLRPRLYTQRNGSLAWSAFDLFNACPEPLRVYDLEGGAQEVDTALYSVDASAGTYFVTVTIDHAATLVELAAGTVTLN